LEWGGHPRSHVETRQERPVSGSRLLRMYDFAVSDVPEQLVGGPSRVGNQLAQSRLQLGNKVGVDVRRLDQRRYLFGSHNAKREAICRVRDEQLGGLWNGRLHVLRQHLAYLNE